MSANDEEKQKLTGAEGGAENKGVWKIGIVYLLENHSNKLLL